MYCILHTHYYNKLHTTNTKGPFSHSWSHIMHTQHDCRSESPCQVFLIIINWLLAIYREAKDSVLPRVVLAYDNMCNLYLCRLRIAKSPLPLPPPLDKLWESVNKIIDKFHLSNHVSQECHKRFSLEKIKQGYRYFNTQAGEQTLKLILCGYQGSGTYCVPWIRHTTCFIYIGWLEGEINIQVK